MSAATWSIKKVASREGSRRPFIWEVTCPDTPPELTWENDFGRGMRCRCKRFRTAGKAERYVERMKEVKEVAVDILPEGIIVTPSGKLVVEW